MPVVGACAKAERGPQLAVKEHAPVAQVAIEPGRRELVALALGYDRQDRTADTGGFSYVVNQVYLHLTYGTQRRGTSAQAPTQTAPDSGIPRP